MTPSIPTSNTPQSWPVPQAIFYLGTENSRMHFAKQLRQVFPILTGRTTDCLSRPISLPAISAWYAAHGGKSFISHSDSEETL